MKKKLFSAGIVLVGIVSTMNFVTSKETGENELLLQNIEALAVVGESNSYNICYSQSKVSRGFTYYDCGSCTKVYDEKGKGSESKCFY